MKKKKHKPRAAMSDAERETLERQLQEEYAACSQYRYLRMAPSALDFSYDTGKEIYSYSDCRGFAEFSPKEQKQMWKKAQCLVLIVLSALLTVWLLFSFIYRLVTETDQTEVVLSMLLSFVFVAVGVAIMLISAFGKWGGFLRFVFRHNLARPRDATSRRNLANLANDYHRVNKYKNIETAIFVCEHAVVILLYGEKFVFKRDAVNLRVKLLNESLELTFEIDGLTLDLPIFLPKKEYVPLKKAFGEHLNYHKKTLQKECDKKGRRLYGGYTLGNVVTSALFASLILAAAILLIVAHYKWLPSIPPFLGIFFIGAAGLAFCNTFHHIPVVNEVLLPLIFSLILTVVPFWANVWMEVNIEHNAFTLVYFLTHCTPFGAGATFLTCMGIYAFVFSVGKAIDYARFGSVK